MEADVGNWRDSYRSVERYGGVAVVAAAVVVARETGCCSTSNLDST